MKIVRTSKKGAPPPPQIQELVTKLLNTKNEDLPEVLQSIDQWTWPRSDLHAWVKVLNKFDAVLEDIIRDYEVDKLQVKPFSPSTKKLTISVLRFERLLLENSTNRKIYSSYDRLNSFLWCSDLDVIIFALNVLLRPAQQYSAQASVSHALNISTPRLQSLCKRWPHIRQHTASLVDFCQPDSSSQVVELPLEAREVNYSFYKTDKDDGSAETREEDADKEEKMDTDVVEGPSAAQATNTESAPPGATQVHISEHDITNKSVMELLADIVKKHSPSDDDKFELLCRIRAAKALTQEGQADRSKLVTIRLLSIAIFGHTQQEAQAASSLFLYEPDLIAHISELLQIDRGVPVRVQTAAIAALDSLSRYRGKNQEVLSSINAGVNHGILMALFRKTVNDIADPSSTLPQSFTDALLSWITYISSHSTGGNMIVGAGLIPLLIQLIENKVASRMPVLSKTMALVDNIMYGYPNAFTMFCNARGVDAVVNRIEYEVDRGIEDFGHIRSGSVINSQGELPTIRSSGIKHILRSMHRVMQASGTSEGLRGLIDTSLLKSVQKIIANRLVFGPNILPLAINVLSTFVHNEPTSLGVIQEAKVPETFFRAVEDGLEASIEVIQSVSNALGALCLNEAGQAQVARRPSIIPGIFCVFTSETHLKVLLEKENAVMVGTAIDELVRHHPGLKTVVFEAIKSTLTKIEEMGRAYEVPDDLRQWYLLSPASRASSTDTDVAMEDAESSTAVSGATSVIDQGDDSAALDQEDKDEPKSHDNFVVSCMDVFGRFLEGLFQHTPHCRDFIHLSNGLTLLGRLTALPCLPYDFASSVASDSMVQVTRTITEIASDETLPHLTKLVKDSLSDTRRFWETIEDKSKLLPFVNLSDQDEEYANNYFRSLVTLHIRVTLLADVFSTAGYAHGRTAVGLLHTLLGNMTGDVIRDLGSLHRMGIWENTLLNAGLMAQGIDIRTTPLPTPAGRSPNPSNTQLLDGVGADAELRIDGEIPTTNSEQSNTTQGTSTSNISHQNARALKHLSHGLPTSLTPFFQAMVKMFHVRRNLDGAQRKQITESSKVLADVMVKHLELNVTTDTPSMYAYQTMMLGLFTILLVDERTSSHALHTVQLLALYRAGGIDSILTICRGFMDTVESVLKIREDERTELERRELIHAYGGIKIALHLIRPIISSKSLFESGQTMTLVTRDKPDTDPDYFEPHNFLVKIRTALLPIVQGLWNTEWLLSAPLNVIRSIVKVTLEIVGGEGEETGDVPPNIATVIREIPPRVSGPDEDSVRMLTEMGFPRSAAERALVRVNNNISAATELLLSHPFPLPPDPVQDDTSGVDTEENTDSTDAPVASAEDEVTDESPAPSGAELEEQPPAPAGKSSEQWKKDLDEAREPLRAGLSRKALLLIDEHVSLLFELRTIFVRPNNAHQKQAVQDLIDDIKQFSPFAYDVQEQPLANRCRLLALVLSESPSMLSQESQSPLMDNLLALLLSSNDHPDHPPKWLASHLLVTEALFTLSAEPRAISLPKEGESIESQILTVGPEYTEAKARVFDLCVRLLGTPDLPGDEFLSVLRLLVFLTRDHKVATQFLERNGVAMMFRRVKEAAVPGSSSYIAIILRHLLEDEQTIRQIMQHTIKRYFSGPRTRTVDVNGYLRSCSALALRSPELFIDITSSLCQLAHPYSPTPIITLKPEPPPPAPESAPSTESGPASPIADMQVDSPHASRQAPMNTSGAAEPVIHLLIAELMASMKAMNEPLQLNRTSESNVTTTPAQGGSGTSETPAAPNAPPVASPSNETVVNMSDYSCFLMQCLSELLFSYESCKLAFLSYTSKKRNQTPAKESANKFRMTTLQFFLTDLITFGTIDPQPDENARNRINLCNWAMSVIVALCVDNIPNHDARDLSSDLVSVRKFVFEAVSRAIKDPPPFNNLDARYGRLLAMADLCHRLLTVKLNNTSRKQTDENPTHIAKIMLEKNFVATLTNALSEIDLNYPNVRGLVPSILRPLEHLTKIAIKMSRASGKGKEMIEDVKSDSESSYASDMDSEELEESGREETPDLYRNSALGMYTGEMDDNQYDESDMDEDEEEGDEDVEMDFADDTGSENTSNSDLDEEEVEEEPDDEGEGWEEGDEEEDDLIQNEEDEEEIDDDEQIAEDDEEGDDEMWQDVNGEIDGVRLGEDDDEEEAIVPIQIVHQQEHGMDPIGSDDEDFGNGGNAQNVFHFSDGLVNVNNGTANGVFFQRRRDAGNVTVFGRARNNNAAAAVPAEVMTHPLLIDNSPAPQRAPSAPQNPRGVRPPQRIIANGGPEVIQTIEDLIGGGAFQLFHQIMSRGDGTNVESIRVDVPAGAVVNLQRRGNQVTYTTSVRVEPRRDPPEERVGRDLEPFLTSQRWTQEVKIVNGEFINDRLGKLVNHVVLALLPAAVEALQQAKALEEEEERKKQEEEKAAAEEQERQKQLAESEKNAEAPPPESIPSASTSQPEDQMVTDLPAPGTVPDTDMADATSGADQTTSEPTENEAPATAESSASVTRERVTVTIHGNPVDITETGIDPDFLEALPDDMREEVLNQHVREQRAARVERPADSQISAEFLDALPPEIRAEIIQQEAMQRAQQSRPGAPAEMDNASFFASLDPTLRQAVLLEQDEGIIQNLPSHILAEVGDVNWRPRQVPRTNTNARGAPQPPQMAPKKQIPAHDAIQLLDRSGVAVLVRLLFFPQVSKKTLLLRVLGNLCENAKTRTELFNLLLSILQDGSGDLAAVDRSFSQLSFKNAKPQAPRTPSKHKQGSESWSSVIAPQSLQGDAVPDLIAQRCLEALAYIVNANELSSLFFLTEHELPASLRRHPPKKGKGKEKQMPQTHYPIVLLLGLLDRQTLLRTPAIVESVVGLLAMVTRPLSSLKDSPKPAEPSSTSDTGMDTAITAATEPTAPTVPATESTDAPATSISTAPNDPPAKPAEPVEAAEEKVLLASPPQIPHSVLRLIVNILTIGECSGRTFQQSLALIQHLSFIPDVRDIIAQELRVKAQEAGHQLSSDLDELATALEQPQSDQLASVAAKFSPASSVQAKLLRVLKTIDYMYSPKPSTSEATGIEDIDKVQAIYESFQFASLWRRLGTCLSLIAENPSTDHIATVLLPLIESLMVVCKYAGAKGSSLSATRTIRSPASPRSPTIPRPESMEDLFVTFTDAHRKLLNLMVRNNPSLMSGSFSLLVHNPRVLDFDNKRNYFNQQLHRRPHSREHYGTLQLNVRRARVFEDSFQNLQRKTGDQIKYGKLSVRFYEEEGVDAGGVTREWFQILARQMFDPNYALFQPCAADKLTYQPNKNSWVNPEHLSFFKFVGRVIGKAIYDGRLLDAYFARSLYRQLLGKPVDYRDVEWVDPEYYNSLCWIMENDPTLLDLTFSVEADEFGVQKVIPLKENGESVAVTQDNKREFVQLSAQYRLYSSIEKQIDSLLAGFYEIIPKDLVNIFNEQELELLISGTPDIDVDEWRAATEYNGYTSSDPNIVWWWRALKSFNRDERAKLLSFATGTSRVPLNGFTDLQGVQGVQRFSIHKAYGEPDRLPQAHTCFNQIDLPQYSSYEMLRQQLILAINEGGEGFAFS